MSHVEERVVGNDYTIRYNNKQYQITRADIRPGLRGATVRVEERGDHSVWARFRDHYLTVTLCALAQGGSKTPAPAPAREPLRPSPGKPGSSWMNSFHLRDSPPLWKVMRQEQGVVGTEGRDR